MSFVYICLTLSSLYFSKKPRDGNDSRAGISNSILVCRVRAFSTCKIWLKIVIWGIFREKRYLNRTEFFYFCLNHLFWSSLPYDKRWQSRFDIITIQMIFKQKTLWAKTAMLLSGVCSFLKSNWNCQLEWKQWLYDLTWEVFLWFHNINYAQIGLAQWHSQFCLSGVPCAL